MSTSSGLFLPVIDWSDPKFAKWNIANLNCNHAQREAFLDADNVCALRIVQSFNKKYFFSFIYFSIFLTAGRRITRSHNRTTERVVLSNTMQSRAISFKCLRWR